MSNKQILQKFYNVNNIRELKRKIPDLQNLKANQIYSLIKLALPQIKKN